jgi:hypothetical protein
MPNKKQKGKLQRQHSVDTGNYIIDKRNIKIAAHIKASEEKLA